jgi:hypothetical protein
MIEPVKASLVIAEAPVIAEVLAAAAASEDLEESVARVVPVALAELVERVGQGASVAQVGQAALAEPAAQVVRVVLVAPAVSVNPAALAVLVA